MGEVTLLTHSRSRTFRDCNRKHHFRYVEGWKPVHESEPLKFGTRFHAALERFWSSADAWGDVYRLLDGVIENDRTFGGSDPESQFTHRRVAAMLRAYVRSWFGTPDAPGIGSSYQILGVEVPFECALINPETMVPSRTWRMAGKIDLILREIPSGDVWVVEHKTTSEDIADEASGYFLKLAMDAQSSFYIMGAESLGHDVKGVIYDAIRKPKHVPALATPPEAREYRQRRKGRSYEPPSVYKSGPRKGEPKPAVEAIEDETGWDERDPRLLYASQRLVDETPEEFGARLDAAMSEGVWHRARAIVRTESQIRTFLADNWIQAQTMRFYERMNVAPKNPEACSRMGLCPYWSVCSVGDNPSNRPDQFVRADVNPELPNRDGAPA